MGDIGLFEAIYSQRAIRSFKPDPVPEELIEKVVEAATKAPSGGNSQPWAFIVVRDAETRAELAAIARRTFDGMYQAALGRARPGDPPPFPKLKVMVDNIEAIPVWIAVCITMPGPAAYGSIFPAVQNLLLAARGLGLGAVLTGLLGGPSVEATKKVARHPRRGRAGRLHPARLPRQGAVRADDSAAALRGPALGALGGRQGEHRQAAVP